MDWDFIQSSEIHRNPNKANVRPLQCIHINWIKNEKNSDIFSFTIHTQNNKTARIQANHK